MTTPDMVLKAAAIRLVRPAIKVLMWGILIVMGAGIGVNACRAPEQATHRDAMVRP